MAGFKTKKNLKKFHLGYRWITFRAVPSVSERFWRFVHRGKEAPEMIMSTAIVAPEKQKKKITVIKN